MPFQRGPYDEILLTMPLTDFLIEEPAVCGRQTKSASGSGGLNRVAALQAYQEYLLGLLSGEAADDPEAAVLYRAVMRGEPLNLYPTGMNGLNHKTFVPVLRRIGDDQWQVGIPGQGHHTIFIGDVVSALHQVWQLLSNETF